MTVNRPLEAVPAPEDQTIRRNTLLAAPFMLLVPVAIALAYALFDVTLHPTALALGAAGWLLALALRAPVSLTLLKMLQVPERVQPWVVASSGPLEEAVRVGVLILAGTSFSRAMSVGLGWAAIEVVYTLISAVMTLSLLKRTDEQALQARAAMDAMGLLRPTSPALGVLERIGASTLHIGFTLLLAWSFWLLPVTMAIHSAVNLVLVRTFRKAPLLSELALLAVAAGTLLAGLALHDRI
jgi:hypothetical protein